MMRSGCSRSALVDPQGCISSTFICASPASAFRPLHGHVGLRALAFLIGNLNPFDSGRHSRSQMLLIEAFLPAPLGQRTSERGLPVTWGSMRGATAR
jgi:hypothetical protein